jgi:hypothetical protein
MSLELNLLCFHKAHEGYFLIWPIPIFNLLEKKENPVDILDGFLYDNVKGYVKGFNRFNLDYFGYDDGYKVRYSTFFKEKTQVNNGFSWKKFKELKKEEIEFILKYGWC